MAIFFSSRWRAFFVLCSSNLLDLHAAAGNNQVVLASLNLISIWVLQNSSNKPSMERKQRLLPICTSFLVLLLWCILGVVDRDPLAPNIDASIHYSSISSVIIQQVPSETEEQGIVRSRPRTVTEDILKQLRENGTTPCHNERTVATVMRGIHSGGNDPVRLEAGVWHTFTLVSMTATWTPRCAGGDYYETDLQGERWRSRAQVQDLGNGSYVGRFMVPSGFPGQYNLSVHLLFDAYHGLDADPQGWVLGFEVVHLQLVIVDSMVVPDSPPLCRGAGFSLSEWIGHWSRGWYNKSCEFDPEGRLLCLHDQHRACLGSLCQGNVARLESNGWVYSAHCKFEIWEPLNAWTCLHGRWLLFWGDSNHADTVRNLLLFVLGYKVPGWSTLADWHLPRSLDKVFVNPRQPQQWVRITLVYNGHVDMDKFGMGLGTMYNSTYREQLLKHFRGSNATPDAVIMNSGLHDGFQFPNLVDYVAAVDHSMSFWEDLWRQLPTGRRPSFVYRTTVAPAGYSRSMKSNPCKMDVFNKLMVDRVKRGGVPFRIIDGFDLTFPWHFGNSHSDGGHYGRAPLAKTWPWLGKPHYYFVDVMLAHILVNAVCDSTV